ncbi:MAG: DUF1080 domain-containing protein [Planctomycetes bacterium]|nr:DUF1080 domain-containing protein [Planctomycetota bacterium]
MTVKEAELKSSLTELEQKVWLAREELDNAKARIESLKDKDLLVKRDAEIRKLKQRVIDLGAKLKNQRGQTQRLKKKKATIRTHLVTPGDTLQSLARKYYGDPNQWKIGSGGLYNNKKNPSKPTAIADNPIGEWNTFYIKMVGERVTVKLNGKLVVDRVVMENLWESDKPIYTSGQIELQNHGNTLWFRNIYIKELK